MELPKVSNIVMSCNTGKPASSQEFDLVGWTYWAAAWLMCGVAVSSYINRFGYRAL